MSFEVDFDMDHVDLYLHRDAVLDLQEECAAAREHASSILAQFCDYAIAADAEIEAMRELAATWSSIAMHNAIQIGLLVRSLKDLQGE